jgi:hypothetical protein
VDQEGRPLPPYRQLASREHPSVVVAQHRDEHHVAQAGFGRCPFDVKVAGVLARRPVLEHVDPPAILGGGDRHVIRHDVQHLAKPLFPEGADEPLVAGVAAQFAVDAVVRHDIVAVRAAGRRLQVR